MIRITAIALALALMPIGINAQSQRTTCYDSGPTRICETFDGMGNVVSKSRCYQTGKDWRCETQSINGGAVPTPLPSGRAR